MKKGGGGNGRSDEFDRKKVNYQIWVANHITHVSPPNPNAGKGRMDDHNIDAYQVLVRDRSNPTQDAVFDIMLVDMPKGKGGK